ncbi:Rho guanine nucleotide exchange factor scd1 [Psilocybe cubensis]|uniref:Rho guanine nucleotide exchange factor scd1 n=2 Tax=Psilocybe cubensis TaxID=181762 RepID=A0A8H7Y3Y0_PSICU|nr:Rho guanine nucleotide exchange factor scd1 [Psilocybe cubensis]KAH9484962.1 Rho guanine nucleotide exchange factor scd1 [Psilocybe cubensis]
MASGAGRKKSIVSTTGLQIDTNANTLLNKSASQSTSLYQQCSALRTRLLRIRGFAQYFNNTSSDSRQSTDPVTQLWDLFSTGTPLCYIFDQLPEEAGFKKLNNSTFDQEKFEANPDRAKKHAIALFAMQIRADKVMQEIPGCELFTVTDLWDRNSTDGLVKVINTVTAIVDHLPPDAFEESPPSPHSLQENGSTESLNDTLVSSVINTPKGSAQTNIIREMVETERKYVQDLEIMQKYSNALSQANLMDQDTIHLLFPNLNKLLNFQRKFLIRLESTAEMPWQEQRWGQHFLESENEFIVYEPYCANYTNATELMLANEQNLVPLNHLINVKGELPGLLIKPIQRICKYPLLLDSLIKACSPSTYDHYDELKRGSEAAKRITDKINEAQRRAENEQTVKSLQSRIDDWKGHHLENFGELLLDDVFVVTKSDIDREYHVFLFERIILCCKEASPNQPTKGGKGINKNGSILKKPVPLALPGGNGTPQKNTPLLLKGRIFLGNVTQAIPVPARASPTIGVATQYPLAVWWKGDDDLEYFTLRCRHEDQMRQWEATINRLIKEAAQRRASERAGSGMSRIVTANSTNPAHARMVNSHYSSTSTAPVSVYSQSQPQSSQPSIRSRPSYTSYDYDDQTAFSSNTNSTYGGGPKGYPPHDGFDFEPDEDELEDYPPASIASSGRGTPVGSRRTPNAFSMPPERESTAGYDRTVRAQTEGTDGPNMAQWRANGLPPLPSASVVSPNGHIRPITPRVPSSSNMSANSYASDASFGTGVPRSSTGRPPLRSQFSSSRLKSGYESPNSVNGMPTRGRAVTPTLNVNNVNNVAPAPAAPPMTRSRSASQPSAYNPPPKSMPPPPLPAGAAKPMSHWSQSQEHQRPLNGLPTNVNVPKGKRGSGSSHSTGESSDYSPNSSSPITPFGSSESSLTGDGGMPRSHGFDHQSQAYDQSPPVKVKVHFHEDIFVIQVPRVTEYEELVEKVGRKIRLCGPRREDGPLRVKYRDEDGDMVSLGSTEDVQMAFEQYRPGGQVVTLFVT